jgi:DNA-binding XRE family transcriptional regulator
VSRQTIYAIEAGTYVPNTAVALHLARELEVTVDELFSLQKGAPPSPESLAAEVLSSAPLEKGQPGRICQMGSRWVSVPATASPYYIPEANGIIERSRRTNGRVFAKEEAAQKLLVLAGCDPATSLLSRMVEKISGVDIVSTRRPANWR